MDKILPDFASALEGIQDGAVVLVGGFGEAGNPTDLLHALCDQGARELTIVSNNAGNADVGIARLLANGRVRKVVCSYPRGSHSYMFDDLYKAGRLELELVPQGTLAERIRAGGAGVPAFYTPTSVGTELAAGKETRGFGGRDYVLEEAIRGDVALIKAESADRWGNLVYRKAARNFSVAMATAADLTIVQTRRIVELGALDPEVIVTPSIFVQRVVCVPEPFSESAYLAALDQEKAA